MENYTNPQTSNPDVNQVEAFLGFFRTPEHHARVKKIKQKQTFHYWKTRLTIDAFLIALGFALGIILV